VIAGVNVIAAPTNADAQEQFVAARRYRVTARLGRGQAFTDEEADAILASPAGQQIDATFTFSAIGSPAEVGAYIEGFAEYANADELIVAHQSLTMEARLRSVELLAEAAGHALVS
jgi:alkanesulfonate monooxygenase SsuD/methylene tetrahydromethanopterin reductase-like flavin-dependent oxidoreductase (luciferase family)